MAWLSSTSMRNIRQIQRLKPNFIHRENGIYRPALTNNNYNINNIRSSRRWLSVYVSGHGWTGAMGKGPSIMVDKDRSTVATEEQRDNDFQKIPLQELNIGPIQSNSGDGDDVVSSFTVDAAAAGWGHSAMIVELNENGDTVQLLVAGRPYEFHTILRLRRIPSILRKLVLNHSIKYDSVPHRNEVREGEDNDIGDSILGKIIDKMQKISDNSKGNETKHEEVKRGIYPYFTHVSLPNNELPALSTNHNALPKNTPLTYDTNHKLSASAGVTAVIGQSGQLYTFGTNNRGQCGIGDVLKNFVWEPTPLAFKFNDDQQKHDVNSSKHVPIVSVALGFQHGLALDQDGSLYSWGKGGRGQLGYMAPEEGDIPGMEKQYINSIKNDNDDDTEDDNEEEDSSNINVEFAAVPVDQFEFPHNYDDNGNIQSLSEEESKVTHISAGLNVSAAVTKSNHAWVWGKNVKFHKDYTEEQEHEDRARNEDNHKELVDSPIPFLIEGLPTTTLKILDISCGSHHTSILMEDGSVYAIGIPTDTVGRPLVRRAVQIIPPGIVEMPIRQFKSHFDRTTIICGGGESGQQQQVLEVQLWSTEDLRSEGVFEPAWVQNMTEINGDDGGASVKMVHRGWLHSLMVTSDD